MFHTVRQRDAALVALGEARAKAQRADSLLALNAVKIAKTDTVLVERLRDVQRVLTRVDTLREQVVDTLYATEDSDRVTPLVVIPQSAFEFFTDSLAPKCDALEKDCTRFRAEAEERFRLYEERINSTATSVCPSRVAPAALAGVLGVVGGVLLRR
jgi:hypothetical protein